MVLAFAMSQGARRRRRRPARKNVEDRDHDRDDLRVGNVVNLIFTESSIDVDASWFEMPWRDGKNAISIPMRYLVEVVGGPLTEEAKTLLQRIRDCLSLADAAYEPAAQLLGCMTIEPLKPWLQALARCVQLYASHSHGGGHAYNALLTKLVDDVPFEHEVHFAAIVRDARCLDAIGTTHHLANDGYDRVRQAFLTLWNGNHHRAIYALPALRSQS